MRTAGAYLAIALAAGVATGCATTGFAAPRRGPPAQAGAAEQMQEAAVAALRRNDPASANRLLTRALQRDPENPTLHALNGLAHHQRVRDGQREHFQLAETAYLVSLQSQRDSFPVALELARLYVENGRYGAGKRAAAYALDLEPGSAEALQALAAAAYYDGDLELAAWAAAEARPDDAAMAPIRPLVFAAAGLPAEADQALAQGLAAGAIPDQRREALARRLGQWRDLHVQAAFQRPAGTLPDAPPGAIGGAAPAQAPASLPGLPLADPPDAPAPEPASGAASYAWWDCQQQLNPGGFAAPPPSFSYGYGASTSADETSALPALPAPCRGQPLPRMAMVDAVILRTDDTRSATNGVNLLKNLSAYVGNGITVTRSWSTGQPATKTSVVTQNLGLGSSVGGVLSYSLNIANATEQRAEILAQPTLLALDRQPAQFFSGSNVTIALNGGPGSYGSVQNQPVGVSLSVTPTFVDDDSMLVSVKAVRSFFEETADSATFAQSVQTSRNMVTANVLLRFDQTLVLSGLSEREVTSIDSRTPLLGDIPGVQHLFAAKEDRDYTRSVVIMLTPRRVPGLEAQLAEAAAAATPEPAALRDARARARTGLAEQWPNLTAALAHMDRNRLFRALRAGDIDVRGWRERDRVEQALNDFTRLLAF